MDSRRSSVELDVEIRDTALSEPPAKRRSITW